MRGPIDCNHACSNARQDRLDEGPARIELGVCSSERARLLFEPARHAVEGAGERLHLVFRLRDGNADGKVTCLDTACRRHKLANRPNEPIGKAEGRKDRQADDDQRAKQQCGVEA